VQIKENTGVSPSAFINRDIEVLVDSHIFQVASFQFQFLFRSRWVDPLAVCKFHGHVESSDTIRPFEFDLISIRS
jgi:archaellum component FlaG (FlaF/FlaG flagellin family)